MHLKEFTLTLSITWLSEGKWDEGNMNELLDIKLANENKFGGINN